MEPGGHQEVQLGGEVAAEAVRCRQAAWRGVHPEGPGVSTRDAWHWSRWRRSGFGPGGRVGRSHLEGINSMTKLDKRSELRSHFYEELTRKPQECVSEFCSRFRTVVAELRSEGVDIPGGELGWFLKEKLGLDAIRKQLLDTALGGSEDYGQIETEVLRLFKDLHVNDPLYRKIIPHRFFRGRGATSSSMSSSAGTSRLSSRASTTSFASSRASSSRFPTALPPRQAHMTETDLEEETALDE